jgi:hypothetical protein
MYYKIAQSNYQDELEIVFYPVFVKLIYIVPVSKFLLPFLNQFWGILSAPPALLDFSSLITVHISSYFGDDTP